MSDSGGHQGAARHRYRVASSGGGHIDELAAGYALGALDGVERDLVEHHVRFCRACADLVAADTRTASFLPFVAAPRRPAPDVKAALFARIAHAQRAADEAARPTHQVRPLPPTLTIPASRPAASATAVEPAAPRGRALAARPGARFGWLTPVLTAPLLLALVVTGAWAFQLRSQIADQQTALNGLEATLANFGAGVVTPYQLAPGPAAPQAEGQILIGPDQRGGLVMLDLNTPLVNGAYEVWTVNQDGQLVPEVEVQVNDGIGQSAFTLDQPFNEYQSVVVAAKPVTTDPSGTAPAAVALSGNIDGTIGAADLGDYTSP